MMERIDGRGKADDLRVWDNEDRRFFVPYRVLLRTDLALAREGHSSSLEEPRSDLLALNLADFATLMHEHLYAETLVRLRDEVTPTRGSVSLSVRKARLLVLGTRGH